MDDRRTSLGPPKKPSRASKRLSIKNLKRIGVYPGAESGVDLLSTSSGESEEDDCHSTDASPRHMTVEEIDRRRWSKTKSSSDDDDEDGDEVIRKEKRTSGSSIPPPLPRTSSASPISSPKVRDASKRSHRRRSSTGSSERSMQRMHAKSSPSIVDDRRSSVRQRKGSSVSVSSRRSSARSNGHRRRSNVADDDGDAAEDASTTTNDESFDATSSSPSSPDRASKMGDEKRSVIKMGRVLKNKRRARNLWKWVNVILTADYLEYSYRRSLGAMFVGRTKHRFPLQSEFTSVTRDAPCIFALHRPVDAPMNFRCASPDECAEWLSALRSALRPFQEQQSQAKQNLIVKDAGQVSGGMAASYETTTPIKMIELGAMQKKAKYLGNWKKRRVRLDPDSAMLELASISDHINASHTSNYFIRGGEVTAVKADGTTTPSFRVLCCKSKKRRAMDSNIVLRCHSQEQFKRAMMEMHAAGADLKGNLVIYGHMKDRISAQIRAKKERRRKELKLPRLMGHFGDDTSQDGDAWSGETLRRFTCYLDLKLSFENAKGLDSPDSRRKDSATSSSSSKRRARSSSTDDSSSDDENSSGDESEAEDPAALTRSLHEPLEIGHSMMMMQGGVLSVYGSQSRRRLVLEGYMLRVMVPGTGDDTTEAEQYVVRGAAVHLSDLWENVILIECWRPPPQLTPTRLSLEPELGLEQTCHILNLLRLRDGILDWRCQTVLRTYKKLRFSEESMKSAMEDLDEHNRKNATTEAAQNGWVTVATVIDEHEISAYERNIKREFNSSEYHEKYFKRAVVTALPQTPSTKSVIGNRAAPRNLPPTPPPKSRKSRALSTNSDRGRGNVRPKKPSRAALPYSISQPSADVMRELRSKAETEAGHISDLKSQWQSALKNVPKHARSKLRSNANKHGSLHDLHHTSSQESLKWLSHMDVLDEDEDEGDIDANEKERRQNRRDSASVRRARPKSTIVARVPRGVNEGGPSLNLSGKHAIFVLGPSAAGKTFLTRRNLRRVLSENAYDPQLAFASVDGGIMRDASVFWNEMKRLPMQQRVKYMGFSDLFSGYFQKHVGRFKKKVFNNLLAKGANMVIPETAADPFPGIRGRAVDWLKRLRAANYSVVMTCVHASRQSCTQQGKGREVKEGKKYSNVSWSWAMSKVDLLFNFARELGYRRETFFVFDNSDWTKSKVLRVPPHHDLDLRYEYTSDGNTHGRFSCSPMRGIPFARMNSILPPADVVIHVGGADLGIGLVTRSGEERKKKKGVVSTLGRTLSPILSERTKRIAKKIRGSNDGMKFLPPRTNRALKPRRPTPVTPKGDETPERRRVSGSNTSDSLGKSMLSKDLEAALMAAHQKLGSGQKKKRGSDVDVESDGVSATAMLSSSPMTSATAVDKMRLELLQDGRSVWLVWSSSKEEMAHVPADVKEVLFSSASDRAIISWGSGCSVRRLDDEGVIGERVENPRATLLLSCKIQGSTAGRTPTPSTTSHEMRDSKRLSSSSISGTESSKYALHLLITFPTVQESSRWCATLDESVKALGEDGYSKLEIFLQREGRSTTLGGLGYKKLYASAEREFGKVFMTLHKSCFLKLYQDSQ